MRDPITTVEDGETKTIIEMARSYLSIALAITSVQKTLRRSQEEAERRGREFSEHMKGLRAAFDPENPPKPLQKKKKKTKAPSRQKRGRPAEMDRDLQIATMVAIIVKGSSLDATRSHAKRQTRKPSACNLVWTALKQLGIHKSERSVEDIWARCKDLVEPPNLRPYPQQFEQIPRTPKRFR